MVYIYKKIIGEKEYYYLRASVRKDGKTITKDIMYLGTDPNKIIEKLKTLPSSYADQIRKSYKTLHRFIASNHFIQKAKELKLKKHPYLSKKLQEEIYACVLHWRKISKDLDSKTKEDLLHHFSIEFAFNTTSLEGNTITLQEAALLLREELTPKNRTLREVYDLQNTKKVFFNIYNHTGPKLTHNFIIDTHKSLLSNVDARIGYRTQEIRVFRSKFDASPAAYVKADMDVLINWYEEQKVILDPLTLAALFHHKFEKIHPFMDGNGRTGRMLLNNILLTHNFPPIIIRKKRRATYLDSLRSADVNDLTSVDNYRQLVAFIAHELTQTYWDLFLI